MSAFRCAVWRESEAKKTSPKQTWTACEALSWGMFGDEKVLTSSFVGAQPNFPVSQRTYNAARRELRDAIAEKAVEARGFRGKSGGPSLTRETLDPEMFEQLLALAVDPDGEITFMHPASPQNIPRWTGVIFEEEEVRALWPKVRLDLDQWMKHSVMSRPSEKRDSHISDCQKATGCTVREAKAAYGRLPPNIKRSRGHRIKAPAGAK